MFKKWWFAFNTVFALNTVSKLNQMSFEDFKERFCYDYNTYIKGHIARVKNIKHYPFSLFTNYLESKHKEELFKWFDKSENLRKLFDKNILIIRLFLRKGLDVNTADNEGNTLLHLAILEEKKDLFEKLLTLGPNVNLKNKHAQTPLHIICNKYCNHQSAEILTKLLLKKPDINLQDNNNQTALHIASKKNNVDYIERLLMLNPDLELIDLEGNTALSYLIKEKECQGAALLLNAGAKLDYIKPNIIKEFMNERCKNGEYDVINLVAKSNYDLAALYSLIEGNEHLMTKLVIKIYRIFKGENIEPIKKEVPAYIIHHLVKLINILMLTTKLDFTKIELANLHNNLPRDLTKEIFKEINDSLLQIIKFQLTKQELKILCEKNIPCNFSKEDF